MRRVIRPAVLFLLALLAVVGFAAESLAANVTFNVTRNAGVRAFSKGNYHFEEFTKHTVTSAARNGTYDVYTANISDRFHYVAGGGDTGFVKTVQVMTPGLQDKIDVTIDVDQLDPSRRENNKFKGDSVYLNANDAQHLVLKTGGKFKLIPTRVWQAAEGFTDNYFIEPDYKIEVLGDANAVSSKWDGAPGLEYAEITGKTPGVAVLRVTYDPLLFKYSDGSEEYYNSIDPVNTGIVVVNVVNGNNEKSGITTGISAREYDTIYFDKDKTDHAEYSFKPSAPNGGEISVQVHRPIHAGGASFETAWSDGVYSDGSFTVDLYEGRNIVKVSAKGAAFDEYHVITAKGIKINVENETNASWKAGDPLKAGDKLKISFEGIKTPLEKIAGIYNPGYPDTCYVSYRFNGEEIKSTGVQYNLSEKNEIEVTVPASGLVRLTGGVINCGHMGDPLDSHRTRIGKDQISPNFAAKNVSGVYSTLPDITLPAGLIAVTVEKLTLGQGFIVEPTLMTISNSNRLSSQVVTNLLKNKSIDLHYDGSIEDNFYLQEIEDKASAPNVPQYILDALGGNLLARKNDNFLSGGDYSTFGGWVSTVNNVLPDVGASELSLRDGDVIRYQFSLYGWGTDLISYKTSWSEEEPLKKLADKDDLIWKVAEINAEGNKSSYGSNYDNALSVLKKLDASQLEVNTALAALSGEAAMVPDAGGGGCNAGFGFGILALAAFGLLPILRKRAG
ncbi:MAG: DUF4430 domain-containing protein [Synergistaceae bacterium]|nr:DUF4430 domain-containing protein [Synergistaceae bacterium]